MGRPKRGEPRSGAARPKVLKTGLLAFALLAACGGEVTLEQAGSLSLEATVTPGQWIQLSAVASEGCPTLRGDVAATLDGVALVLDEPGGKHWLSPDVCDAPRWHYPTEAPLPAADAPTAVFRITDPTRTLELEATLPFAARSARWVKPPDGVVRPGEEVELAWAPATDVLPADSGGDARFEADSGDSFVVTRGEMLLAPGSIRLRIPSDAPLGAGLLGLEGPVLAGIVRCDGASRCRCDVRQDAVLLDLKVAPR